MRVLRNGSPTLVLLVGLSLAPRLADAHPHIFVADETTIIYRGGATALQIVWTFDEMYSLAQPQEADTNDDGITTDAELAALAQVTRSMT